MHLQSHPSRIYFYSRLRQLLRMKLVRKVSRELDKERKASSAEHKNTVFKQVKNPQLRVHSEHLQNILKYSLKRRQSSSPVAIEHMKKSEFSTEHKFVPAPVVCNRAVFVGKNEATGVQRPQVCRQALLTYPSTSTTKPHCSWCSAHHSTPQPDRLWQETVETPLDR